MSESYRDAKAVLDIVKSSAWGFFKFRVSGEDIDKSFVHCKLCLDAGQKKKVQIKYCGGTTNLTNHLKTWHKADYKSAEKEEAPKESIIDHFGGGQSKAVPKWLKSSERWKKLTLAIAKWFCKSSRSTKMSPDANPPSRKTLAKYIKLLNKWRLSLSG